MDSEGLSGLDGCPLNGSEKIFRGWIPNIQYSA